MIVFVSFSGGSAVVEQSKIKIVSSPAAKKDVMRVLRGSYVSEEPASVVDGVIVEGRIRKLKRGTDEFDRAALSTLPAAYVMD